MSKAKLVFFGNQKLATGIDSKPVVTEALKKAGYEIASEVTGEVPSNVETLGAEAAVLVAYGRIIPQAMIDLFPKGIINIHPSLLPKYRGPTPIEQAILDGAVETGVSLMKLSATMDAGPVFASAKIQLSGDETKQALADKLLSTGTELLIDSLPAILEGSAEAKPQDDSKATYTSLIKKADGYTNFGEPAELIERKVRAYDGWPRVRTLFEGHEVLLTKVRTVSEPLDKSFSVKCDPGWLEIQELIGPSGRTMSGADFLRGYKKS